MKIFHIKAPDCSFEAENRFSDLVAALAVLGISQKILMNPDDATEELLTHLDVPFITQKFSGLFDLRTQQAAQQIAESFGPHIIQTHSPQSSIVATKIVHQALRIGFSNDNAASGKKMPSGNDIVLSVAYPHQGQPLDYDILPVPPLVASHDGLATPVSRSAYNTPAEKPLIGTMIDFDSGYDLDKIFHAIREIPELHFWIIGRGPGQSTFFERARRIGVHDRVHFINPQDHSGPDLLKSLDAAVVPFRQAGCDRITLESWSCGLAVISGMPQDRSPVNDGEDALMVAGGDPLQWRKAIIELTGDDDLRRKLEAAGRERFRVGFEPGRVVRHYLQSYETALKIKA